MIKLQVIGHLGRDAEVNTVNSKTVINFNVAHSEKWKDDQGQQKEKTVWVQCAYWTDKTGIVPYLLKGAQVWVEGQPEAKSYQAKDGTTGVNLTVRVGSVQLLGSPPVGVPPAQAATAAPARPAPQAQAVQQESFETLPF